MTALVASCTPGATRNNFDGYAGIHFTVGGSAITVTQVGRRIFTGNTATHDVVIANVAGAVLASATVVTSGGTVGTFAYTTLGSPVVLAAGVAYYLGSHEVNGGDLWGDSLPATLDSAVTLIGAAYNLDSAPGWATVGGSNVFVPTDLIFGSGSSITGAASLSASSTLTAAGFRTIFGAAALSATGTLTAGSAPVVTGAAAMSATATMTATGSVSTPVVASSLAAVRVWNGSAWV